MDDDRGQVGERQGDRLVTLEYDFLKHITSLSLLSLGGVVTFAGSIFEKVEDQRPLWLAALLFMLAGLLAFLGQLELLKRLRESGRQRPRPRWQMMLLMQSLPPVIALQLAAFALCLGSGLLLGFAFEALN